MSLFTSQKSEPTVLLWGDRWWLPKHRIPVPFGDPAQAADMLAAAWPGRKPVLRVVYQPEAFASVAVACPEAGRSVVSAALADEHPALSHPGHVWGFEPVLEGRTLLHYETEPGLFALVRRMEDLGFGVESVWPMATWLAALAPEATGPARLCVLATDAERWLLYRQAGSEREVRVGVGSDGPRATLGETAGSAGPFLMLHITTDEAQADDLHATLDQGVGVGGGFPVWEALAKPVRLPAKHPAQLLPPLPKLSLMRIVIAANLLCLLVAVVAGCRLWWVRQAAEAEREVHVRESAALRAEVEAMRARAAEITRLERRLGRVAPAAELLNHASVSLPERMVLTECQIDGDRYRFTGWVDPALPGSWDRWTACWRSPDYRWRPPAESAPDPDGRWIMEGELR